ncbi:neutral cholesterol ester hydrolase 1-like [Mercenaria mercenaria]|uniref:neutral cholesterol ester hydrolase 1-like n=1 Tax=Mercenaria mercenaria TaxID=6596 RepID=UPI001E1D8290|nr:neutral cholesterol ester hydrolase 1-like [Mercenaria mercenaria]
MGSTFAIILSASVFVLIGYYLNVPLPENISERWKLKIILAGYKLAHLMTQVGTSAGFDSSLNITRITFGTMFAWTSQPVSPDGLEIFDSAIENVPVRVYRPKDFKEMERLLPVLLYYHGGGMITFSLDTYEQVLRQMAKELQAVIVSVGYRLAPEHKFPAAIDDCFTVTDHVLKHASVYGGDETRVAIAGDSAGGNLAAAVSWRLAYNAPMTGGIPVLPKFQVLLYPMLQAFDFQISSYVTQSNELAPSGAIAGAWYMYCTGKLTPPVSDLLVNNHTSHEQKKSKYAKFVDSSLVQHPKYKTNTENPPSSLYNKELASEVEHCIKDPSFAPLMAENLSKFPMTYILSAEFDILRDESFMFEARLKSAGVNVTYEHLFGAWHGVVSYTRTSTGRDALQRVIRFIRERL